MRVNHVDAYLAHGQLVSGSGQKDRRVTGGLRLKFPALENLSSAFLNRMEDEFRSLLRLLPSDAVLQFRLSQEGDFEQELTEYYNRTLETPEEGWTRRQRLQTYLKLSELREAGLLRKKRICLYLSLPLKTSQRTSKSQIEEALKASGRSLEVILTELKNGIERLGGTADLLDEDGLFEECFRYLNASVKRLTPEFLKTRRQPEKSIIESCLAGEMAATKGADAGFYYDSNYHHYVALKELPHSTISGMMAGLCSLPIGNYSIEMTVKPLELVREVEGEEQLIAKLGRALTHKLRPRAESAMASRRERVERLLAGEVVPFEMQFVLHAWDGSREKLQDRMIALKSAVNRLQGARYWEIAVPTSARNLFLSGVPGAPWLDRDFMVKIEDHTLANLLPVSGGSDESLENAEAIFPAFNGSLLGVNTFQGREGDKAPVHAAFSGMTGGGKSVGVTELLTQTHRNDDFTAILDDGLSYATYVRTNYPGYEPLVIEAGGTECLNYLDTGGRALTQQHLLQATAVLHLMAGESRDEDVHSRRAAVISNCLHEFYHDWAEQVLFKKAGSKSPSPKLNGKVSTRAEAVRVRKLKLDKVYAQLSREEMPTHSDFHDWLKIRLEEEVLNRDEIAHLVTTLGAWRADCGGFGAIFDGINTIDFSGPIVYLELGRIGKASSKLRQLASFIIATQIRNEITNRPRSQRKRVVFEELSAFLEMEAGGEIVRDFYERGRKYNCWVVSVIQQLGCIPTEVARSVLGNCRQGFFFRQEFAEDVKILQEVFRLPKEAADSLLRFPDPSPEHGAPFLYWKSRGEMPLVVNASVVTTPETLYVAGSSGEHFEERQLALANYPSVQEGVIAESAKQK